MLAVLLGTSKNAELLCFGKMEKDLVFIGLRAKATLTYILFFSYWCTVCTYCSCKEKNSRGSASSKMRIIEEAEELLVA